MKSNLIQGLLLLLPLLPVQAEILPSFDHGSLAKNSDHVVLATEGESIDGKVIVLASYKGDLEAGTEVTIPELAKLKDPAERKVHKFFGPSTPRHKEVSGNLMILFLNGDEATELRPSFAPEWFAWLCWIEDGMVYAKSQPVNPGDTLLLAYGESTGDSLPTILSDISGE